MDLPKELRLKVYEFALATTATLLLPDNAYTSTPIIFQGIALLCSSWMIKEEALPVFYAVNKYYFHLDETGPICSTQASNHFAKMRYISISYKRLMTPPGLAGLLNKVLDKFPQLHSFSFYMNGTWSCPPPDSTPKVIRDLRQRLQSMGAIFFVEDEDGNDDNLQDLLDVIRPHDEWRQQICNHWPHCPTWKFDTPDVGVLSRVWSTNRPGYGIEELW